MTHPDSTSPESQCPPVPTPRVDARWDYLKVNVLPEEPSQRRAQHWFTIAVEMRDIARDIERENATLERQHTALAAERDALREALRGCSKRLQCVLAELAGTAQPVFDDGPAPAPLENIKAIAAALALSKPHGAGGEEGE